MKTSSVLSGLAMLASAVAQQVGTQQTETHPKLSWQRCTGTGGTSCTTVNAEIVIDANWRWVHATSGYENCYDGNVWTSQCSSNTDCAQKCAVEGADYAATYGITSSGNALTLKFTQDHAYGKNIGSRTYLMEPGGTKYQMFTLRNNEFAFDVDLSTVECGVNSALYFVPMKADGGLSSEPNNKAGAKYGLGYCDAQCARDLKFVGGQANYEGWEPSDSDENAGVGNNGSCCAEIDVWESNAWSYALTPHGCRNPNYHVCQTTNCGGTYSDDRFAGDCDANGCDYNPFRLGNPSFYGKGKTVNTNSKFTVVTRFQNNNIYNSFIQGGRVIRPPAPAISGVPSNSNTINPTFCSAFPTAFNDRDRQSEIGGFGALNTAIGIPMVLVMSIWADHYANMLWLDSIYPPERAGQPGAARGECPQSSGVPDEVISQYPNAKVTWSNIRFGPIGSTHPIPAGST